MPDYNQLDYSRWTFLQQLFRGFVTVVMRLLARVEVEGMERIPREGAFILAPNHLHVLDVPVLLMFVHRRTVPFAADKWVGHFFGWILTTFGNAIFVARGTPDRRALSKALTVLKAGGVLALAPEGTRSLSGGLGEGHTGLAYLATRAPAPILPVVAYGQEKCFDYWRRLRRVPIRVRFGQIIELPPGRWPVDELEKQTEQIMFSLAEILPMEYRGIYAKKKA
jgi:1-acyl-sn-glycerol-3-phosphate acyltransferase